jgi:hypothetical protein
VRLEGYRTIERPGQTAEDDVLEPIRTAMT